jgi:hypothetical protein
MVTVVAETQAPERVSVLLGAIVKCINSQQYVGNCASSASGAICQSIPKSMYSSPQPSLALTRLHDQKHAHRRPSCVSESVL